MKILYASALLLFAGCSALTLAPSDFSWPVESELTADKSGIVQEDRYHLQFGVKPLLFAEFQDSSKVSGKTFRIIRDREGYYYITGPGFKNVYVFEHKAKGLTQSAKILVHDTGLKNPAFNSRPPYIQLLNGKDKPVMLTKDGVKAADEKGVPK